MIQGNDTGGLSVLDTSLTSSAKQSALLRILKATTTLPARVTFYASALGAIALIPAATMSPALAALAGGVGINALSSILERVAKGETVTDEEIQRQVQAAIADSDIANLLRTSSSVPSPGWPAGMTCSNMPSTAANTPLSSAWLNKLSTIPP